MFCLVLMALAVAHVQADANSAEALRQFADRGSDDPSYPLCMHSSLKAMCLAAPVAASRSVEESCDLLRTALALAGGLQFPADRSTCGQELPAGEDDPTVTGNHAKLFISA
jgi:hypothetical protein